MAFIKCSFKSKILDMDTEINVIIPNKFRNEPKKEGYPTLYLLHGLSDDNTAWWRYTSIERYAEERGVIVVMPCGWRSFYTDMKYGPRVFTYISSELIEFCEFTFPVSSRREDRFIAGLSMGGYGAFKFALSNPENYAAAASLSGAVDIIALMKREQENPSFGGIAYPIYGEKGSPSENDDLFQLLSKAVNEGKKLPKMFMICGTEDFLYEDNVKFSKHLESIVPDATIRWEPGDHQWSFWDKHIQEVLNWLPVKT